jgi:hypothetical protein
MKRRRELVDGARKSARSVSDRKVGSMPSDLANVERVLNGTQSCCLSTQQHESKKAADT